MSGMALEVLRHYGTALSRFTLGNGLLWAGWWAWMGLWFLSVSEAYRRAGNVRAGVNGASRSESARGRFIGAGFLAVAAGAPGMALVLGDGLVPTAWGVFAAIGWLGGWMNLDRWRQTGRPWV